MKGIFNRDIKNNTSFCFRSKQINPHSVETDSMELLFNHLTTEIIDKKTRKRNFESERSKRLHWIKYHKEIKIKLKTNFDENFHQSFKAENANHLGLASSDLNLPSGKLSKL